MSVGHKVIFFPLPQWSLSAQHCVHDHNSHYPLENNNGHHNNTIVMLTATTWWWRLENWRSGVLRQVGMKPWCRMVGGSVEIGVNDEDYYRWTNEVGLYTHPPLLSCFLYPSSHDSWCGCDFVDNVERGNGDGTMCGDWYIAKHCRAHTHRFTNTRKERKKRGRGERWGGTEREIE